MRFRILRVAGVLIAAIGGVLIGYTCGMAAMYNETMGRLGLIEGGSLATWDVDTLMDVEGIMRFVLPPATAYAISVGGLFIILTGVVVVFMANQAEYRRPSNVFLLAALALAAGVTLTLGPSLLGVLLGIKRGSIITMIPGVYAPVASFAWAWFILGVAFFCLVGLGGFLFLRKEEK